MPLKRYNRYFGGKEGAAAKAHAAMIKQYGEEKGEQVFYATKNKNKSEEKSASAKKKRKALKRGGYDWKDHIED